MSQITLKTSSKRANSDDEEEEVLPRKRNSAIAAANSFLQENEVDEGVSKKYYYNDGKDNIKYDSNYYRFKLTVSEENKWSGLAADVRKQCVAAVVRLFVLKGTHDLFRKDQFVITVYCRG